jgi:hypothetical protein
MQADWHTRREEIMDEPQTATDLVAACNRWRLGDAPGFAAITAAALRLLGLYQRDLADEFDVSTATVSRWASGDAKPHTIVQEAVVDFVRRRSMRAAGQGRPSRKPAAHPQR